MARATYSEVARTMALNGVDGVPFRWPRNTYRGCPHRSNYRFARVTHRSFDLNAGDDCSTRIMVDANFADVLRRQLARPARSAEPATIGAVTDPYQPCEGRYRISKATIEVLAQRHSPLILVTKTARIQCDVGLLEALARVADVSVHVTVTTLDPATWRAVEPETPPPWRRLAVLRRLVEAGIPPRDRMRCSEARGITARITSGHHPSRWHRSSRSTTWVWSERPVLAWFLATSAPTPTPPPRSRTWTLFEPPATGSVSSIPSVVGYYAMYQFDRLDETRGRK